MALPASGPLGCASIGVELGITPGAPASLGAMSITAGFTSPDAISEFYGYSVSTIYFSSTVTSSPSRSASCIRTNIESGCIINVTFDCTCFIAAGGSVAWFFDLSSTPGPPKVTRSGTGTTPYTYVGLTAGQTLFTRITISTGAPSFTVYGDLYLISAVATTGSRLYSVDSPSSYTYSITG